MRASKSTSAVVAAAETQKASMVSKVKSPKISANVEEQTITNWFKAEGETVKKGEPLVEITTDKAAVEVPAPRGGVLRKVFAKRKSTVPVGYIIALIGAKNDELPDVTAENKKILSAHKQSEGSGRKSKASPARQARRRVRATPAARRLAREHSVDLGDVAAAAEAEVVDEGMVRAYVDG